MRQAWVLLLLFASSRTSALAATLEGRVQDAQAAPVQNAKLELTCAGKTQTVFADAKGYYRFASLPRGTCRLHASQAPAGEATLGPFLLEQTEAKTLNITLRAQPSSVEFFDPPTFTVAGVTDNTYLGGHGSDTVTRSKEDLAKAAASLDQKSTAAPGASSSALTAMLKQDPGNAELHARMANAKEQEGQPLQALREYQRAAELDPSETYIYDWAIELLVHAAPTPANEIFDRGIRLFPKSARMRLGAAAALYTTGTYSQAAARFFEATDLNPKDPGPYLLLAKVQTPRITESAGFTERMARFAQLQPDNPWANYYYAQILWRTQKNSLAGQPSCAWSTQESDNRDSAKPQRSALSGCSLIAEVQHLLENALRIDPNFAPAYLQRGMLYAEQNDLPRALPEYQAAIKIDPQLQEAHYRLAQAYRQTGSPEKAREETAIFQQLSATSAKQVDRERSELQKFVVTLKTPVSR